jgi:hypothetical protein
MTRISKTAGIDRERQSYVGGSDARIIMGADSAVKPPAIPE